MGLVWSSRRPEVQVSSGRLRGVRCTTPAGTEYNAFLGIPYAKPPVGELRFKNPEPIQPWTGVRDAGTVGNMCPQKTRSIDFSLVDFTKVSKAAPALIKRYQWMKGQSEDCLYLNVYSTSVPAAGAVVAALRPVLFWIHGGAFQVMDGNPDIMNPELFLDKNMIVVTVNYRLGPFGFLSLGTADVPGNAGLKDQAMALRWTYDNIRAFGGDPEAITVFGESAGGASAHFHYVSPMSRGLFRGVIASSGTSLMPWATTRRSLDCARGLAAQLGLQADTPEQLAAALRAVDAAKLVKAANRMPTIFDSVCDELMFLPVVEPDLPGAFLTEHPEEVVRSGRHSPVPLIVGMCSCEGLVWLLFADETLVSNKPPLYFLPPELRQALTLEQQEACHRDILHEYVGDKPFTKETVPELVELSGDVLFGASIPTLIRMQANANRAPVFLYLFHFDGKLNFEKSMAGDKLKGVRPLRGAGHGADLMYLSPIKLIPAPKVAADSREMICRRRMVQLWANFVETGDPTPPGTEDDVLLPLRWPPCTADARPYLLIDDTLEIKNDDLFPRQKFWNSLYQKYLGT